MSKRVLIPALLAGLLGGGAFGPQSCVQFDGQSVIARRDVKADRLDLLLIYRDLHTTGDPDKGLEQLEAIRGGARWFAFVSNFPLLLNLEAMTTDHRRPDRPAGSALLDALVVNTTVRTGGLWLDGEGRVCGSQLVRLEALDATLRAANAAIREELSAQGGLEEFIEAWHLDDAESRRLLREALASDHRFVGLSGSAPTFTLPVSDAGFVTLKRALLDSAWDEIRRTRDEPEGQSASESAMLKGLLDFLALNEWTIERSLGRVTFVLGNPLAPAIELTAPSIGRAGPGTAGVLARRALADTLRQRGWKLADASGEAAARAGYETFVREP